jgi:transcriptional regulator with XRE-family HTH domain
MLKPIHARMARAALDWSLRDLEERTGINKNTLARFESGKGVLLSTAVRIEDVFAHQGITFIYEGEGQGPGIIVSTAQLGRVSPAPKTPQKPKSGKRTQKGE